MVKKVTEGQIIMKFKDRTDEIPLARKQVLRAKRDISVKKQTDRNLKHWFGTPKEKKSKYYKRNMELRKEVKKSKNKVSVLEKVVKFFKTRFSEGERKFNQSMKFDELKQLEEELDE